MKEKVIKTIKIILIILVISIISIVLGLYVGDSSFRFKIDKNIFGKYMNDGELVSIGFDNENTAFPYVFDDKVVIVEDNTITFYNRYGKDIKNYEANIQNAIFDSNGEYLLVGALDDRFLYLFKNTDLIFEKELEGNLLNITLNENGASACTITGTTYRSIILAYDTLGKESFRTYIANNLVTDVAISNDQQFLSIIESSYSKMKMEYTLSTISKEKATTSPTEATIYTYTSDTDEMFIDIKYSNDKLLLFSNKNIYECNEKERRVVYAMNDNTLYASIELNSPYIAVIKEETEQRYSGKYVVRIIDTELNKEKEYYITNLITDMFCGKRFTAVVCSNSIYFLDSNAMLKKQLDTQLTIKNIYNSEKLIAIQYKNELKILEL